MKKILIEFNELSDKDNEIEFIQMLETLKTKYLFDWKDGRTKQDVMDDEIKKLGEELDKTG
jgi:hypothetical protein